MGFEANGNIVTDSVGVPIKLYAHEAGLREAFSGSWQEAMRYGGIVLGRNRERLMPADFVLAVVWSDGNSPIVEAFSYFGVDPWPGNPEVRSYVFKNGVYVPEERGIECEDTTILRGQEGQLRRRTKSLEEYRDRFVDI